ncbi:elongation factor 1-gamma [Colletotrichum lupini]|uniref:Elongation factor 1-gamma n=1 Tax=Colletotrichum lupini TaxID=145971 RepID=A0A9Q8SLG6_9PEZI|nr:elongation factor 1-gamma [Colletotrichum lupini]UQC79544.1 elongation factor 1-gamma [Colletotrichum lupini]
MSFGKLYTYPKAPRSTMVLFVAKYNKLDVEICNAFPIKVYPEKGGVGEEYLSKFHTGKVPALETADGFTDPNTKLCGSGLKEETTVLRWASFTNYELLPPIMAWIGPIIGRAPSSPEILKTCEEACEVTIRAIEKEITGKNYLVGDTLTLADLFVVSGLARGYQYVFTKSWAEKHPVVHEYYMHVRNDKDGIFDSILGSNIIRDEPGGTYPDYDGL